MATAWGNLYYATSYLPLARFLSAHQGFAATLQPWAAPAFSFATMIVMRLVQLAVAVCMIAAAIRPAGMDPRRFMALFTAMILTTVTNGSSGYALIFLFFLVFFEPWRGPARIAILVSAYLLCLPVDWSFWPMMHGPAHSFLGGARRDGLVRRVGRAASCVPGPLLIIQVGLIVLNFQDILATTTKAGSGEHRRAPPLRAGRPHYRFRRSPGPGTDPESHHVVDFVEEVEEQLRSDRYRSFAQRAWPWFVAALVAVVIGWLAAWGI